MEEKSETVKSEETTVGPTMNYNPFSFISCQEDALVLAGCISHGLDADDIKKSGDLFATVEEDLGLKRYRMFQAIAYGETAISVELDLYAELSAMVDKPLVG